MPSPPGSNSNIETRILNSFRENATLPHYIKLKLKSFSGKHSSFEKITRTDRMSNVFFIGTYQPTNQRKIRNKERMDIKYLGRGRPRSLTSAARECNGFRMTLDKPIMASTKRGSSYSRVRMAVRRRSSWMRSWGWSDCLIPCAGTIDSHR